MKAIVTGASSGIGRDISRSLAKRGWDLILVARREERLLKLKEELNTNAEIFICDFKKEDECLALYEKYKNEDIDMLVNNAGFGAFGEFLEIPLKKELEMINVNINAVHILTKLFLNDFVNKNKGIILNTASTASFMPGGPLLDTYYATKSYVLSLTNGIAKELKYRRSEVKVCALCPGPVNTEFLKVAKGNFNSKGLSSEYVADYAVARALKGKTVIVPGVKFKMGRLMAKILPDSLLLEYAIKFQEKRK